MMFLGLYHKHTYTNVQDLGSYHKHTYTQYVLNISYCTSTHTKTSGALYKNFTESNLILTLHQQRYLSI